MKPPMDIDDEFDKYMRITNPTVPQHCAQYRESRRCFFAGMWLMVQHAMHISEEMPEPQAAVELASITDQLWQFKRKVEQDKD